MIEAEVHLSLHNFLRSQAGFPSWPAGFPSWPHHLTMARLVARALRLGRSALIQVGAVCGYQGRYRTSFVASALMWHGPVIIVAPEAVQQRLLKVEIPRLQQWLQTKKPIRTGDDWPGSEFQGILLTTPAAWLSRQLADEEHFPAGIPTIIDGVDDLEDWVRQELTQQAEMIRSVRAQLTKEFFQHPANPYECYLISQPEVDILQHLYLALDRAELPEAWKNFWQQFQYTNENLSSPPLLWATIARRQGLFSLHCESQKQRLPCSVSAWGWKMSLASSSLLIAKQTLFNCMYPISYPYRTRQNFKRRSFTKFGHYYV